MVAVPALDMLLVPAPPSAGPEALSDEQADAVRIKEPQANNVRKAGACIWGVLLECAMEAAPAV
jgi:hypothetical protein